MHNILHMVNIQTTTELLQSCSACSLSSTHSPLRRQSGIVLHLLDFVDKRDTSISILCVVTGRQYDYTP